jgi:hypothetical protein
MKRKDRKPTLPGTVIDARGITLSAGVTAFDEALVKRFRDGDAAEAQTPQAFGEQGPAAVKLSLPERGDDP